MAEVPRVCVDCMIPLQDNHIAREVTGRNDWRSV